MDATNTVTSSKTVMQIVPTVNYCDTETENVHVLSFECNDCGLHFLTSSEFDSHIEIYHPEETFQISGEKEYEQESNGEFIVNVASESIDQSDDTNVLSEIIVKSEPVFDFENDEQPELGTPSVEFENAEDCVKKEPMNDDDCNCSGSSFNVNIIQASGCNLNLVKTEPQTDHEDVKDSVELRKAIAAQTHAVDLSDQEIVNVSGKSKSRLRNGISAIQLLKSKNGSCNSNSEEESVSVSVSNLLQFRNGSNKKCYQNSDFYRRLKLRKFICEACGRGYPKEKALINHMKTHTGELDNVCFTCGKGYSNAISLSRHVALYPPSITYPCNVCGSDFNFQELESHIKEEHELETPYYCEMCKDFFPLKADIKNHINLVHSKRPIIKVVKKDEIRRLCRICNERFPSSELEEHELLYHPAEESFICATCDAELANQEDLVKHLEAHELEKKFVCPFCQKRFTRKEYLKGHCKRVHKQRIQVLVTVTKPEPDFGQRLKSDVKKQNIVVKKGVKRVLKKKTSLHSGEEPVSKYVVHCGHLKDESTKKEEVDEPAFKSVGTDPDDVNRATGTIYVKQNAQRLEYDLIKYL